MAKRLLLPLLLLMLAYLQYRLWVGQGSMEEVARLERELAQQRAHNAELEARNAKIRAEVKALKNDLSAVEARARQELGYIRDGETYYLFVDQDQLHEQAPAPDTEAGQ